MNNKIVSIIILCLMILGTLPLYSSSAGTGEDSASTGTEKSAKAPKSPESNGELSELTNGTGANNTDRFGWNVSYAGDLNGDSIDDIIVGAPYNDSADGSIPDCGAVYIFFGYSSINLNNINATNANVSIYGTIENGHFGWSVSDAGKVDETSGGYDDIIIGEPDNGNGKAYLFFGRSSWSSSYTTANANATLTVGATGDKFGSSVSGAGNVNNAGGDDIIIGAYANGTDKGKAYIYYGPGTPSVDNTTYVDTNATTYGTIENFTYAKADDADYANLTEGNTAGGSSDVITNGVFQSDNTSWTFVAATGIPTGDWNSAGYANGGCARILSETGRNTISEGYWEQTIGTSITAGSSATLSYAWKKTVVLGVLDAAIIYVTIVKPDASTADLDSDATLTYNVWTPVSNKDVSSFFDQTGTYKIRLRWYVDNPNDPDVQGTGWFDEVSLSVGTADNYQMDIEFNTTDVISAAKYYLQLNYQANGENFDVFVYNGATWDDMGDLTATTMTETEITLNSNQRLGDGYVRVRFVGQTETGDGTNSSLYIEYHRIRSYSGIGPSADVTLTGENDNDKFGYSVSDAGNVNGDSYDDVIVGAPGYNESRGKAYVYYGYTGMGGGPETLFSDGFESGDFTTGGWTISTDPQVTTTNVKTGTYSADLGVGDTVTVNDIIKTIDTTGYVNIKLYYSVATAGLDAGVDYFKVGVSVLPNISGSWVDSPIAYTDYSFNLSSEAENNANLSIKFYLYRDTTGEYAYVDDISVTGVAAANVTLTGNTSGDQFGYSVSNLSDVNGDGYDDVIVGAPDTANGSAYVIYGNNTMQNVTVSGWGARAPQMEQLTDDGSGYYVDVDRWQAQSFTPTTDFKITKVVVGIWDAGTVNTPTTAICADDGTGLPDTTQVLTSANVAFGTQGDWYEVVFATQPTLSAGTTYWIVIEDDSAVAADGQAWLYKGSNVYAGGMRANQTSGVWGTSPNEDFCFGVCGQPACATPNVTLTGATSGDQFGYSVSGGNLTGDNCSEIIVGAPYNNTTTAGKTYAGAIYVFNGSSSMASSISALDANYTNYGETGDDSFGFSVSYCGDVNNDSYNDTIVGAPYYGADDNGKAYVLTCRRAILTVSNWTKNETTTVNVGTTDVLMLNMTLTASECTIRVTNIRVNLTGTGVGDDVSACRLFHDLNNDGAYDSGDEFLGNETFVGGSLNFTTLSFDVASGAPEKLLLLFNISSGATVDKTVGANLTDYSFISVARPDNVSNYNFPIQSTNMKITSGVAGDTLTVEVIGTPIAPEFVNQGSTNRTMLNLTFNASANDITITSINISLTGTGIGAGDGANVSEVTIYNDTDSSGNLTAGDEQLNTTQVFLNGYVLFGNLNFNVYYADGNYTVFVVYNISSTATINATVGANLTNEDKVTVSGTDDSVNSFSTIWSDNSTIIEPYPPGINYTIRNGTTNLEEGVGYRKWGNWTIDPGADPTNSTNWLRVRNTNCSKNDQQFVVDFSNTTFNQTTGTGKIPIDGNITFWYFFTNSSSDTNATWVGARYNTTNLTTGSYTFTFNKVGEYIWIVYRMEGIPDILDDGDYTASFTVTLV